MDRFSTFPANLGSPAEHAVAVTPDDAAVLPVATRAVHIGTGGDLAVVMVGGEYVIFKNMQAGWQPIRVSRILFTGTTASGITGVW